MNKTAAASRNLSLNALRGAVGGVVGAGDAVGCWDQLVWLWRILSALDGLMVTLWAIVYRLRAGEIALGGVCPAGAMALGARPVVAASRLARVRARTGVRTMPDRRGLTGAMAPAGGEPRGARPLMEWGWRDRGLVALSPVQGARWRMFSEPGWGASRSCDLIVPVG
jgi:hypothetical protein